MFEWTRDWLRLRREHSSLLRGATVDLFFDDDAYAFARRDQAETVVLIFNRAPAPKEITFPAAYLDAPDGARLDPLLVAKDRPAASSGAWKITVPARTAVAYRVQIP